MFLSQVCPDLKKEFNIIIPLQINSLVDLNIKNQSKDLKMPNSKAVIKQCIRTVSGKTYFKIYQVGKSLGQGSYANCFEILQQQTLKKFACKAIEKCQLNEKRKKERVLAQIKLHRSLFHKNVVTLLKVFQDELCVYIVLQLCKNNSLVEFLKQRKLLHQLQVKFILQGTVCALKYIHSHRIIHRDIKPGNIFLSVGFTPKLGDFGMAIKLQFQGQKKRTVCGTPAYISPDVLQQNGYSYQTDIWSLGVMVYFMIFGSYPYQKKSVQSTLKAILCKSITLPKDKLTSLEAKNLIYRMLQKNSAKRITIDEILGHPFLTDQNIPKRLSGQTIKFATVKKNNQSKINENKQIPSTKEIDELEVLMTDRPLLISIQKDRQVQLVLAHDKIAFKSNKHQKTRIRKWIDMSHKYGVGFQLTNGAFGATFKDNTALIIDQSIGQIMYVSRKNNKQQIEYDAMQNFVKYQKKIKLVNKIKRALQKSNNLKDKQKVSFSKQKRIYPKQIVLNQENIVFRMSNDLILLIQQSGRYFIFSLHTRSVQIVNANGFHQQGQSTVIASIYELLLKSLKQPRLVVNNRKKV